MNFRKIYENNVVYEKGNNGPFDKLDTSIKSGKEQKPAVKGTPHFKLEKGDNSPENKPVCPYETDTYNVRYSKTGSLSEKEIKELNNLGILEEGLEDNIDNQENTHTGKYNFSDILDDGDEFDIDDPTNGLDDEEEDDEERR